MDISVLVTTGVVSLASRDGVPGGFCKDGFEVVVLLDWFVELVLSLVLEVDAELRDFLCTELLVRGVPNEDVLDCGLACDILEDCGVAKEVGPVRELVTDDDLDGRVFM